MESTRAGAPVDALFAELNSIPGPDEFSERCETFGVFTNYRTLEVDLFKEGGFVQALTETLCEEPCPEARRQLVDSWEADPATLDEEKYLKIIDAIGKGRFSQRLATRIEGSMPPEYIAKAIEFVVDRV